MKYRLFVAALILSSCSTDPHLTPAEQFAHIYRNVNAVELSVSGERSETVKAVAEAIYGGFTGDRSLTGGQTLKTSIYLKGEVVPEVYCQEPVSGQFCKQIDSGFKYTADFSRTLGKERFDFSREFKYIPSSVETRGVFSNTPKSLEETQRESAEKALQLVLGWICRNAMDMFAVELPVKQIMSEDMYVRHACLEWLDSSERQKQLALRIIRRTDVVQPMYLRVLPYLIPEDLSTPDMETMKLWFDAPQLERRQVANALYDPCKIERNSLERVLMQLECRKKLVDFRISRIPSAPPALRKKMGKEVNRILSDILYNTYFPTDEYEAIHEQNRQFADKARERMKNFGIE